MRRTRTWVIGLVVVALAAVVAAVALRPSNGSAVHFSVAGGQILGPDRKPFVPVGMNLLGPDGFFNANAVTAGLAGTIKDRWGLNTVRLNACLPQGCPYSGVHNRHNDDLDALVDEYTGKGLVVILALHQDEPGTWPTDAQLDDMATWWHQMALRYGGNERVWFNLLNEPGSEQPVPHRWLDVTTRLLNTVRSTGARNLVVVDGTQWGQEAGTGTGPVPSDHSAILTFGGEVAALDRNVVFSFHVYDQWGAPSLTDAARDARLADFVERVRAAGHAVIMGEVGGGATPCCSPASLGAMAAYRVAARLRVGLLAWHGQAVDSNYLTSPVGGVSSPDAIGSSGGPANLTWQGRALYDLARKLVTS